MGGKKHIKAQVRGLVVVQKETHTKQNKEKKNPDMKSDRADYPDIKGVRENVKTVFEDQTLLL